jgi:hypothetical protein
MTARTPHTAAISAHVRDSLRARTVFRRLVGPSYREVGCLRIGQAGGAVDSPTAWLINGLYVARPPGGFVGVRRT